MSVTRLIIARHGNTFGPDDVPTRVGLHTDLPLVKKGHVQAKALGHALKDHGYIPDFAFSSELQRTKQTLQGALDAMQIDIPCHVNSLFNEIDYGPDENKVEADVIARIGIDALTLWDTHAVPPQGWLVDVEAIKGRWQDFADDFVRDHKGKTALVVTSNGIARFAPVLTGDLDGFCEAQNIKLSTGAFAVLEHRSDGLWGVQNWNVKP